MNQQVFSEILLLYGMKKAPKTAFKVKRKKFPMEKISDINFVQNV